MRCARVHTGFPTDGTWDKPQRAAPRARGQSPGKAFREPCRRLTMRRLLAVGFCGLSRSRETYNALTNWLTDARTLASPDIVIVLVGNKKDLEVCQLVAPSPLCARATAAAAAAGPDIFCFRECCAARAACPWQFCVLARASSTTEELGRAAPLCRCQPAYKRPCQQWACSCARPLVPDCTVIHLVCSRRTEKSPSWRRLDLHRKTS